MATLSGFTGRVRDGFSTFGRELGRILRRRSHDVAVTIEERPDVGPIEVDLPYPIPTREDPLALVLFYATGLILVISVSLVVTSQVLMGYVPSELVNAIGAIAVLMAVGGNLTVIARPLKQNATSVVKPLVGASIPLLNAVHYWFNPVVAVLALMYVMVQPSNNWLMPVAALVLLTWAVTGLLLKLPRDSPWNGPMLKRSAGSLHRRPFVYIALITLVSVSFLADLIY
jgi:hypothetical protein